MPFTESVLHLKRADLPPSVRSYVDNLKVQVQQLLKAHNAKNLDDFKRLIREKQVRVEAVENLQKLLNAYATAVRTGERPPEDMEFFEDYKDPETGETKEIRLDLNEALKTTSEFFRQFGLDELRAALPKSIHLTDEQKEIVRSKMREGFNLALVMPPLSVLNQNTEHIIEATSMVVTNRSKGYPVDIEQITESLGNNLERIYINKKRSVRWLARKNATDSIKEKTPYLLLLRGRTWSDPYSATSLRERRSRTNDRPLALNEFFIIGRLSSERSGGQPHGALIFNVPVHGLVCQIHKYFSEKRDPRLEITLRYESWDPSRTLGPTAIIIPLEM